MKAQDLYDYKIMLVTSDIAFLSWVEYKDAVEHVGEAYHDWHNWANIEDSTKDMVANIATILMDENFFHTYFKYAN